MSDSNTLMHSNDSNDLNMSLNGVNRKRELIYPELSYELTGIFYEIHNELGRHLLEKQYADAFEVILKSRGIQYKREARLNMEYRGEHIFGGSADFIIDDKVVVDFKAKKFITKDDYNQMLRYLKVGKLHLGLIVNFRSSYLKPKRILNNDFQ